MKMLGTLKGFVARYTKQYTVNISPGNEQTYRRKLKAISQLRSNLSFSTVLHVSHISSLKLHKKPQLCSAGLRGAVAAGLEEKIVLLRSLVPPQVSLSVTAKRGYSTVRVSITLEAQSLREVAQIGSHRS